jgi:uncharacterized membrane protein (UPF0136 family)
MKEASLLNTAVIGLLIGCIFGMAGSFVPSDIGRTLLWAIDGCGITLATALLTIYFSKKEHDILAAGFLLFTIAETVVFLSSAGNINGNITGFGVGSCLWALAIVVISSQKVFPLVVRCIGIISAVLFAIVAFLIFTGHPVNGLTKPLPFFAYPFFTATLVGWAWSLRYRKHTL